MGQQAPPQAPGRQAFSPLLIGALAGGTVSPASLMSDTRFQSPTHRGSSWWINLAIALELRPVPFSPLLIGALAGGLGCRHGTVAAVAAFSPLLIGALAGGSPGTVWRSVSATFSPLLIGALAGGRFAETPYLQRFRLFQSPTHRGSSWWAPRGVTPGHPGTFQSPTHRGSSWWYRDVVGTCNADGFQSPTHRGSSWWRSRRRRSAGALKLSVPYSSGL